MPKQPEVGLMFPKQAQKKKRKKHPASIVGSSRERCFLCSRRGQMEAHHIFGGPDRKLSEEYGLKVYLCGNCHQYGAASAHRSRETADYLHRIGQQTFEEQIGSRKQFMELFRKNYLEEEEMTKGTARRIVKNIHEDESDPEEKLMDIQEVIDMETHNSITKQELLGALRWILEEYL